MNSHLDHNQMNPLTFYLLPKNLDLNVQHHHVQDHLMRRTHNELNSAQFDVRKVIPVQPVLKQLIYESNQEKLWYAALVIFCGKRISMRIIGCKSCKFFLMQHHIIVGASSFYLIIHVLPSWQIEDFFQSFVIHSYFHIHYLCLFVRPFKLITLLICNILFKFVSS